MATVFDPEVYLDSQANRLNESVLMKLTNDQLRQLALYLNCEFGPRPNKAELIQVVLANWVPPPDLDMARGGGELETGAIAGPREPHGEEWDEGNGTLIDRRREGSLESAREINGGSSVSNAESEAVQLARMNLEMEKLRLERERMKMDFEIRRLSMSGSSRSDSEHDRPFDVSKARRLLPKWDETDVEGFF